MSTGYEIGEFEEDGALDELDSLIAQLVQRIENVLRLEGFCGVDISGVRANMALLATVIRQHGGSHLIQKAKVREWGRRMDEPFVDDSMWGFTPWPEEVKARWRVGCQRTLQRLLAILEE